MIISKSLLGIIGILLLVISKVGWSSPSASVSHKHGERAHSHPLPVQGITHQHGGGAVGTNTSTTRYQNTIIYDNPRTTVKPARQDGFNYNKNGERVFRADDPIPNKRRVTSNQASKFKPSPSVTQNTKGDKKCRFGESDCNVCATNVQRQFQQAASGKISWQSIPWNFTWPQRYAPRQVRPLDVFDGAPAYALGIPNSHIQGFVKTNSQRFPYAGSHSHKKRGSVFVIKSSGDGQNYLSSLHQTKRRHPSGVHIIGKYLVYGLVDRLIFKDINSVSQSRDINLHIPQANFGGGVGIVRISRDRHLIVTSGPGGQDNRVRFNHFYQLNSVNGVPKSIRFLNKSTTKKPTKWPKGFGFSENLSLITECGTGNIYAVHTTGDEKGISAITGNGYWRLSKLVNRGNILGLTAINAFTNRQNMSSCSVRATGTVYVNPQNKLEFYCHGYAKDPDGSTFNVLGRSSRNADKFFFKKGVVR